MGGGKSIENQGLQFFHIQRVVLHTPGDQVPTFLRDWIHLLTPVPNDSLSVDAMDIDDSLNTKDGSAMDVDDPQSDPLPIPTTSGTSKIINISDEESNPSSYHSDINDAPNNAPEPTGPIFLGQALHCKIGGTGLDISLAQFYFILVDSRS
ncbi:hypothetical protein BS47DRAFT_1401682 [Hydnum rufescens UP504]|uniref:Uncharacterized protein n=1 Tax=Hydnum rufescens UP504 TaxID=1448309 RepID=A0A9P6DMJ5_9AGAM|nr:hypothetical protein BS47DRAFT_1401682 [Hydnum rufescens UP504]